MVRNYKRKTDREEISVATWNEALTDIKVHRKTFKETSIKFNIPLRTLQRYAQKSNLEELLDTNNGNLQTFGGYAKKFQVNIT